MNDDIEIRNEVPVPEHLIVTYRALRKQADTYNQLAESVRSMIESRLGTNEVGTVNGQPAVRWTHVASRRLSKKLLTDKFGADNITDCYAVSMSRRFVVIGDD